MYSAPITATATQHVTAIVYKVLIQNIFLVHETQISDDNFRKATIKYMVIPKKTETEERYNWFYINLKDDHNDNHLFIKSFNIKKFVPIIMLNID